MYTYVIKELLNYSNYCTSSSCLIMQLCNSHLTLNWYIWLRNYLVCIFKFRIKKKIWFKESFLLYMKFCEWLRHSKFKLINFYFILITTSTKYTLYMHVHWFCGFWGGGVVWNLTVAYKDGRLFGWLVYVVILDK